MEDTIIVSVIVITYQHRKYVRKALDSVLMQKTKYAIEIIVADDCSTDGTKEILKEYKKKYGNRITLFIRNENVGGTANYYYAAKRAKGKYIAAIEGDDYWTDIYKLEKQIEYLELHPYYIGVFHKCHFVGEHDNKLSMSYETMYVSKTPYTLADFESGILPGHTAAFMYRNVYKEDNGRYNFFYRIHHLIGDQTNYCILLSQGDFGYIEEDMSAYRIVVKKNGTNAASIAANNNNYFGIWKYYCDLEICAKRRLQKNICLEIQKRKSIYNAFKRMQERKSAKDIYIFAKIIFFHFFGYFRILFEKIRKQPSEV